MPEMMVWPVSVSVLMRKVWSSSAKAPQSHGHLLLVGLGLRLDGHRDDGLREGDLLQDDGVLLVAEGHAHGRVLHGHGGGDLAGEDLLDLLALVGVHAQQAAHALRGSAYWRNRPCRRS